MDGCKKFSSFTNFYTQMNPQEQSSAAAMDNELFQMYAHYQLCRVKKGATNSSNAAEKKAIVQILEACQHIHASRYRAQYSTCSDDIMTAPDASTRYFPYACQWSPGALCSARAFSRGRPHSTIRQQFVKQRNLYECTPRWKKEIQQGSGRDA